MDETVRAAQNTPGDVRPRPDIVATVARWGVAVILVGVVVNLGMAINSIRAGAAQTISRVSPSWLIAAAILGLIPVLFHGLRILLWSRFLGAPTTLRGAVRAAFGTELGSSVSPKAIGGAPVKIGLLMETGHTTGSAASITLLNNLEDAVLFSILMPLIAVVTRRWQIPEVQDAVFAVTSKVWGALPWVLGIAAVVFAYVKLRRRGKATTAPTQSRIASLVAGARDDFFAAWALVGRRGKLRFAAAVGLTTVQWTCRWSVATAVMIGLGLSVDPVLFLLLQWVVFTAMLFMPTPGAALGAEASFAAVLGGFIPGGLVGLVGAAWRFFTFYFVLLVGVAAVPLLGTRRAPRP